MVPAVEAICQLFLMPISSLKHSSWKLPLATIYTVKTIRGSSSTAPAYFDSNGQKGSAHLVLPFEFHINQITLIKVT